MRIHRIWSPWASSYLLEDESLFLVDAGYVGHHRAVLRRIREIGRRPDELRLAVATHGHIDHIGGLAKLREVADFDVVCHPDSARGVSEARMEASPGRDPWGRFVSGLAGASLPYLEYRGAGHVIEVEHDEDLHPYGLPGRVVHTPGHTRGCLSVLLDDGTAITGDLVMTGLDGRPISPNMAVCPDSALASWRELIRAGCRRVLPAHGRAFTAPELTAALAILG